MYHTLSLLYLHSIYTLSLLYLNSTLSKLYLLIKKMFLTLPTQENSTMNSTDTDTLSDTNSTQCDKRWLITLSTFCKTKQIEWKQLSKSSLYPHPLSTLSPDEVWKRYYHIAMGLLNRYSINSNSINSILYSIDLQLKRGQYVVGKAEGVRILYVDDYGENPIYVIVDEYSTPKTVITQSHYDRLVKKEQQQ